MIQNKLDKAYFQHEMAYGDFNDLTRRTASGKILLRNHLILLKIQNIMSIKGILLHWCTILLIKNFWWCCKKQKYVKPRISW